MLSKPISRPSPESIWNSLSVEQQITIVQLLAHLSVKYIVNQRPKPTGGQCDE